MGHPPLLLLLAALRRDGGKYAVYAAGDASLTAGAVDRDALELLLLALVASNMVLIISVNWSLSCPGGTAAALARVSVWQAHPSTQRSNGQTVKRTMPPTYTCLASAWERPLTTDWAAQVASGAPRRPSGCSRATSCLPYRRAVSFPERSSAAWWHFRVGKKQR